MTRIIHKAPAPSDIPGVCVTPDFIGQTAVVIGTGPSIKVSDLNEARAASHTFLVGINDTYKLGVPLDAVYACDSQWWGWSSLRGLRHFDEVAALYPYSRMYTADPATARDWPELTFVRGRHAKGFSRDPSIIHFGRCSGFQAVNLAMHLGAVRVLLLGFDMRVHTEGADKATATLGLNHWFGHHPNHTISPYALMIRAFEDALPYPIPIINCTPRSALRCMEYKPLSEALTGRVAGTIRVP